MKIIFDHIKLRQSLKRVAAAVNNKSILPALENVHLQVTKTSCTLTTTDLSAYMQTTCDCDADGAFETLLPFTELQKISHVIGGPLTIEVDVKKCRAKFISNKDVFEMGIEKDASVFPTAPAMETKAEMQIDNTMIELLAKMSVVTKTDAVDPRLEHVCFALTAGKPVLVYSSDGFRGIRYLTTLQAKTDARLLVHKNHFKHLREIGAGVLSFDDRWLKFVGVTTTAFLLLGEYKYPESDFIYAAHTAFNVNASKSDLQQAIEKVMVYNTDLPKLNMKFGANGHVDLRFHDADRGYELKSTMQAVQELEPVEKNFNVQLFGDILKCFEGNDDIDIDVLPGNTTGMYVGSKTDPSVLCIILPLAP